MTNEAYADMLVIPEPTGYEPERQILFPVCANSPFGDGFDIDRARKYVREFENNIRPALNKDQVEDHPLFALQVMLEEREQQLRQNAKELDRYEQDRRESEPKSAVPQAARSRAIRQHAGRGMLTQQSSMQLHTNAALKLLEGSEPQPGRGAVPSMHMAGKACGKLFNLSSPQGLYPWANVALMTIDTKLAKIDAAMDSEIKKIKGMMNLRQEQMGITDNLIVRTNPYVVEDINFMSPYGFKCRDLIAKFDFAVRHLRTIANIGLYTQREAKTLQFNLQRICRGLFNDAWRYAGLLTIPPSEDSDKISLVNLTCDMIGSKDKDVALAVAHANDVIGYADPDIYLHGKHLNRDGTILPQYLPRNVNLRNRRKVSAAEDGATEEKNAAAATDDGGDAGATGKKPAAAAKKRAAKKNGAAVKDAEESGATGEDE